MNPELDLAWRPLPASTLVVRAGYGIYDDTSVYLPIAQMMAQQAPLSTSVNVANSSGCPLTLADGFQHCAGISPRTFGVDPHFRVGYAQELAADAQRDLPGALVVTLAYSGIKGTRGMQESLPNTYPIRAPNPCPACPAGFVYRTSSGNSTREAGADPVTPQVAQRVYRKTFTPTRKRRRRRAGGRAGHVAAQSTVDQSAAGPSQPAACR